MFRRQQAILGYQTTDLVGLAITPTVKLFSAPVCRLDGLVLPRLHRHEAHVRSAHGFADRLGIPGVILVAFHIRLHELRGNQLDGIAS